MLMGGNQETPYIGLPTDLHSLTHYYTYQCAEGKTHCMFVDSATMRRVVNSGEVKNVQRHVLNDSDKFRFLVVLGNIDGPKREFVGTFPEFLKFSPGHSFYILAAEKI